MLENPYLDMITGCVLVYVLLSTLVTSIGTPPRPRGHSMLSVRDLSEGSSGSGKEQ